MTGSTDARGDAGLVRRLHSGDQDAFHQLMRAHGPAVYRYAWAVADSSEQVDDLVQDTFLVLWRRRRHIALAGDSLLPWLLATCRYAAFNANRRRRRAQTVPLEAVEQFVAHSDDVGTGDDLRWVRDEIARLSERDQRLIHACVVQGRTYEDAARDLEIPAATARKRMQRIRQRLRAAQLKEES